MTRIVPWLLGAGLTTLALSGCAASAADVGSATSPTPSSSPSTAGDGFLCSGLRISREAEEKRIPVSAMSDGARVPHAEALWDDGGLLDLPPDEGWYVATMTDELIGVMRDVEVGTDPMSGDMPRDREVLTITWVKDAPGSPTGWYVSHRGSCALTVDLGDLTVPAIELQSPPDPTSQKLRLLVTEQTCNGGEDAAGRMEVVSVDETDDRVSLVLGVRPRSGPQACPSNPATPFTITLSQPLGEREVVDATLANPRVLTSIG